MLICDKNRHVILYWAPQKHAIRYYFNSLFYSFIHLSPAAYGWITNRRLSFELPPFTLASGSTFPGWHLKSTYNSINRISIAPYGRNFWGVDNIVWTTLRQYGAGRVEPATCWSQVQRPSHRLRIRILRILKFPKIREFFTNFKTVNFKIHRIQIHSSPSSSSKLFVANITLNFWIKNYVMSTIQDSLTRQQFSMITSSLLQSLRIACSCSLPQCQNRSPQLPTVRIQQLHRLQRNCSQL